MRPTALDLRLSEKAAIRIAEAASRPGDAESRPWMACGGESDMDEHGLLARHCRAPVRMPGALRRAGGAAQRRPAEPGSIPRPGRRCFRSLRTDRPQKSPPPSVGQTTTKKGRPGGRPAHTRGESRESYCSLASSASPEAAAAWALYSSAVSLPSASASAASTTWVSAGTVATPALLRLPSLSTSRPAQVTCFGSAVGPVACGDDGCKPSSEGGGDCEDRIHR